jgi:hypothetical protein
LDAATSHTRAQTAAISSDSTPITENDNDEFPKFKKQKKKEVVEKKSNGIIDILNPSYDMYDGLDSYLNEQFMKMEAKKHKLEAPDSDRNKGNHTKKNPSEVFKRLTIGLNTPLNLARKGVIMDNQSRKTI